ncbi:MAG: twin-arginine translocase subunit TatC [Dehalococcoidia bacterium]|nr:MAG: twin-arginine translocase subunit TatC [Dehalococcoidia bacterium]
MTRAPPEPPSEAPQEPSSERYMSVLEHLEELRFRLFISGVFVIIGLGVSVFFGQDIIDFLKKPAEEARSPDEFKVQFIEPFELFVTYFRVSLLGGLILGMPMIVYQGLRFVSPGLKPNERWWLYATVLGTFVLFLGGVAFAYYIALPPALGFLLDFGGGEIAEPDLRIGSYVDFVTRLLFWTGVAFQTPLVVMYLSLFGIVSACKLLRLWRFAVVIAFVVAAIVTPTIDPVTQSLVAGPIIVLYFLGIVLAVLVRPRR